MKDVTLLLVDDNPANLAVLYDHLQTQGYRILIADNGIDAVEQVNRERPDLILLDIRMPGMDGYETCRAIKSNPANNNLPIMFLSALADVDDRLKGFEAGGIDYIAKPLNVLEVSARIQTHVTVSQLQAQLASHNARLEALVASRTKNLEEANASLKIEIARTQEQRREKERLLALLEQQNQQLRRLTEWLLQSRPDAQIDLMQLVRNQLLDQWVAQGRDLDKLQERLSRSIPKNEGLIGLINSMKQRNHSVELDLRQLVTSKQSSMPRVGLATPQPSSLSEREQQILILLCDGYSTTEVSERLSISDVTTRTHRARIMRKLNIPHLPGLVKFAIRHGLTDLDIGA